jgi:diguanylate cyclase (GGDEF)-like protein
MDKAKILIVDDERFYIDLLVELLAPQYRTIVVRNGEKAIEQASAEPKPDLVLLDIELPGIDGYEVCRRLKKNIATLEIPVIFLTVKANVNDEIRGFELGAVDYIYKPISHPILQARVKNHITLKNALEATRKQADDLRILVDEKTQELSKKVTENQEAVEKLRYLANYDPLTRLPNRVLFKEQLTKLCKQALQNNLLVAVLLIDLDRFKRVNDSMGHHIGDELLQMVALRIQNCLRKVDILARLGGDEFTVALSDLRHQDNAASVAQKIVSTLNKPFDLEGRNVHISASIGITIFPNDNDDLNSVLQNADMAMYQAKNKGKDTFEFFTSGLTALAQKHIELNDELRSALAKDQFQLYFQPIIDLSTDRIVGAEALLRWNHPTRGVIKPSEFLSIAEETGLICKISEWVFKSACDQAQQWRSKYLDDFYITVNASPREFGIKTDFVSKIMKILEASKLPPERLKVEITESLMMENLIDTIDKLKKIKQLGVGISVDDFGTGYSSLSYIRQFPVDTLKIDHSFINEVTTNADDAKLIQAIIAMAEALKLLVIAEGVESIEQLQFLKAQGCQFAQGYFISPPLPIQQFEEFIQNSDGILSFPD